jgi:hypothetical protein
MVDYQEPDDEDDNVEEYQEDVLISSPVRSLKRLKLSDESTMVDVEEVYDTKAYFKRMIKAKEIKDTIIPRL